MAAILPSRMEVIYCTSGLFRSEARQAISISVSCLSCVDLKGLASAGKEVVFY